MQTFFNNNYIIKLFFPNLHSKQLSPILGICTTKTGMFKIYIVEMPMVGK